MPHSPSASKEGKRLELPDDGLRFVSKRSFSRFLAMLSSALGISIKIDGATSSQSRDGELNFKLSAGGGAGGTNDHPFKCPATADGTITPTAGIVNGNVVTGTPSVSDTGTQVVYVEVRMTLSVTAQGYVAGTFATETDWLYAVAGSLPADTSTRFYQAVATYVDGVLTTQHLQQHQRVRPRDDGSGTSNADAIWWPVN